MNKETEQKAINIAKELCGLSDEELLNLPNVDDYDFKIEYLKFEEGTPFPEEIHRNPHVAYKVDNLEKYIADADSVICGPMMANEKDRLAFVWKDGAIIELYEEN